MIIDETINSLTLEEKAAFLQGWSTWTSYDKKNSGIPVCFLSDGPHGLRKQAGTGDHLGLNASLPATCFPTAATMANSWDEALGEELGRALGREAAASGVNVLLGPGLNMKRSPLCGRNFEYFSEDPYLAGKMAAAYIRGIQENGVAACPKPFAVNSQELRRMAMDSVVDERTLREIYLTGFEIAVKEGKPRSIMSSYNKVNGTYANENAHLLKEILRDDWGFDGFTMTDWWANLNRRGQAPDKNDFAAMAMAQNDVYMVTADGAHNPDNVPDSLKNGGLTRGELQRNAMNILRFLLKTHALKRMMGCDDVTEIINRPADVSDIDSTNVVFYDIDRELTLDLSGVPTDKGSSHVFGLNITHAGVYRVTITASCELSELAQTSVSLFALGSASGTYTFNGTSGKLVSQTRNGTFLSHFMSIRLYFGGSGLKLHSIRFEYVSEKTED